MTSLEALQYVCQHPHPEVNTGTLHLPDIDNYFISPGAYIDLTDDVTIGEYCMIGEGSRILTHDHYHNGLAPLLEIQKKLGVKHTPKVIGKDVWLHYGAIVLYQVDFIPDGTVLGASTVLTRNPYISYGIWAGNPATLVGER